MRGSPLKIAGVIIAGGEGKRLGLPEKPLAPFRGRSLLDTVVDAVRPQVSALALDIRSASAARYAPWSASGIALLHDPFDGEAGPLGGVVAALEWASGIGAGWLATFPADTPFLPRNLVDRLSSAVAPAAPAVATSPGGIESLCALWPVSLRLHLEDGVRSGEFRSVQQTLAALGAAHCVFEDDDAFFNVNTPADLAEAERRAAARAP